MAGLGGGGDRCGDKTIQNLKSEFQLRSEALAILSPLALERSPSTTIYNHTVVADPTHAPIAVEFPAVPKESEDCQLPR